MSWYEIYLEEIKLKKTAKNYIDYKIKHKKKLIDLIKKYSPNKKVIETGCGTGIISTYLSSIGYDVVGIDISDEILGLARDVADKYFDKNSPKFINMSIFDMKFDNTFDVAFSNGVLEHFSDEEIIDTINKQLDIANYVIIGIPTKFFNQDEALYGDERFLDIKYWRELINKANGIIIEETSYHYMTFKEKLMSLNKLFRPKPFRVFVVKKDK